MSEKNKASWNAVAAAYSAKFHTPEAIERIVKNPSSVFCDAVWSAIQKYVPDLRGKHVCVPSSGDNHAVFAFALLGAHVTSCDIAENQLAYAERVTKKLSLDVDFICTDTMGLPGVEDDAYDFVYTSNGVHVWITDLMSMYRGVNRVLKRGGAYIMYEVHPFQRPFNDDCVVVKPYDSTGPFDYGHEVKCHWRMMDVMNAIMDSGLTIKHMREISVEKDYERPFWISLEDELRGVTATREEVDRMYDWHTNPMVALPEMLSIAAVKE